MTRAVATVVTRTHLATAMALFDGPLANAAVERFICLADDLPDFRPPPHVHLLRPADLGIPNLKRFLFQYAPLELVCALKPYILRHLLRLGHRRLVYLDSDVLVLTDLADVFDGLADVSVLLTPHLTDPLPDDGRAPDYRTILRSGVYNGGFVGVGEWADAGRFVDWWCGRTACECVDMPDDQLYVDQKWLDLVPGLFDGVSVSPHPGWNLAYWNLHGRVVANGSDGWMVNGQRLGFVHFSGFELAKPGELSRWQTRHRLWDLPAVRELAEEYARRVSAHRPDSFTTLGYGYATLTTGEPIRPLWREAVRVNHPLLSGVDDPFDAVATADLVSRFAAADREERCDDRLGRFQDPRVARDRLAQLLRGPLFGGLVWAYRKLGMIRW